MTQADKAAAFAALQVKGNPFVLFNIWDAGSAAAVVTVGAPAVATGSWSVAGAQGYADGEAIPRDFLLHLASRIAETVDVPLTVDFEGGYAVEPEPLAENIRALIASGAVGLNFEDQVVGGEGLHAIEAQAARIRAIGKAAEEAGVALFINARTDLFLKERDPAAHAGLMAAAIERAAAYAEAGASGFFAPALVTPDLIGQLCGAVALPVNIMALPGAPDRAALADLGVARISHGPGPWRAMQKWLADAAAAAMR
ncbi:MAG: isocitrate lyase/phosphoenolpyruvate mutase family protein [Pseudomonadota bacterium]